MSNDTRLGLVLGIGLVLAIGVAWPRKEAAPADEDAIAAPTSRVSGAPRQSSQTLTPVRSALRSPRSENE